MSQEPPVFVFVGVPDKIEPVILLPDWICWWLKGFYPNFHYIYSIWYTMNKEKTLHNLKRHYKPIWPFSPTQIGLAKSSEENKHFFHLDYQYFLVSNDLRCVASISET